MRGIRVLVAMLALAACAAAHAAPPFAPAPAGQRAVYRGATLIDGTGAAPRPDMAVINASLLIRRWRRRIAAELE